LDVFINDFLRFIHKDDEIEKAIVYNRDGQVLFSIRNGTANEVEFDKDEFDQMKGTILVHSHVDNGDLTDKLLSGADMDTAAEYQLHLVIAVTKHSVSAFSPGSLLPGNHNKRDEFIEEYEQLFENGKASLEKINNEIEKTEIITKLAKEMSDYLKETEKRFGHKYYEWGVFE